MSTVPYSPKPALLLNLYGGLRFRKFHRVWWAARLRAHAKKRAACRQAAYKIDGAVADQPKAEGDADVPALAEKAGIVDYNISKFFATSAAAESDPLAVLIRSLWIHRGGPVTRLADMPAEKQAEMRLLYHRVESGGTSTQRKYTPPRRFRGGF